MQNPRKELIPVFLMLVVVAGAGLLMRSIQWVSISPFDIHDLRNAHSHMAFLGWIFPAVMVLLERIHQTEHLTTGIDKWVFRAVVVVNVLMFGSFLIYGYGPQSVVLLSLHTILAVIYGVRFWNRCDAVELPFSASLTKMAMATMMASFLGPLAIPIVKNLGMGPTEMKMAIHFYLHFQYNAFFILAVFGMISRHLPANKRIALSSGIFLIGVVGTYLLTIQWAVGQWLVAVGVISAGIQFVGGVWLLILLIPSLKIKKAGTPFVNKVVILSVAICIGAKLLLQVLTPLIPKLAVESGVHSWVIAFLHLIFLGVATPYILLEMTENGFLDRTRSVTISLFTFLIGFGITEIVLAWQGAMGSFPSLPFIPFTELLFTGSLLIFLSTFGFTLGLIRKQVG